MWVALAVGNGLYFSFSVFLVPLVEEFHWSRGLTAGAQSVSTIGPWFGGVVHDVMGTYRVVFLASVGFCALGSTCFWLARRRVP